MTKINIWESEVIDDVFSIIMQKFELGYIICVGHNEYYSCWFDKSEFYHYKADADKVYRQMKKKYKNKSYELIAEEI